MEWITIALVLSAILNLALAYGCWNALRKIEAFEVQYVATKRLLENMLNGMREIDDRGIFEKDDEVGGIFEQLKILIQFYNKLI